MHSPRFLFLLAAVLGLASCAPTVITDSAISPREAIFAHQPPDVLPEVQSHLVVVDVRHYGFDGRVHQGQIVVHEALADDIRHIFTVILETRFPLESVLPIAHPVIQTKGPFGLSPDTNNSSGYVWRPRVGGDKLSMHALGLAVDLNPRLNPYFKGDLVLPPGAVYDPSAPGTLTPDCPVVLAFKDLGWEWGGDWTEVRVDYMHFQKIPPGWEDWVGRYRRQ
ncbi:MAG: M15 family peptidase [Deltaproteobacteria bacterium]|nr:M15 family peptidase [Deltaproteobacteria bacterium]